jgi:molybdate transport system substrate-binding protein
MKKGSIAAIAILGLMILLAQGVVAEAVEIKVLFSSALRHAMNELGPQFERAAGHKLVMKFDVVSVVKRQIDAGEGFDVAILNTPVMDDLVKTGKVAADTRADVARSSGLGVFVCTGVPKPDISSAEAFKRAMLNAPSIAYSKGGGTDIYLEGLFKRLGIAEQMKSKTKYTSAGIAIFQAVAKREAELALSTISSFEPVPGVELLGPFPAELQFYAVYTACIGAAAKESEAAKALINFLKGPAAVSVFKANGMEPIIP